MANYYDPENDVARPFPANTNLRVLVSGLVLCNLAAGESKFRFLRNVPGHSVQMVIKEIDKSTGTEVVTTRWINPAEDVVVKSKTTNAPPASHDFNGSLGSLVAMRTLHGDTLEDLPSPAATSKLSIFNSQYYNFELTKDTWHLTSNIPPIVTESKRYCFILGGYQNVTDAVSITVKTGASTPTVFELPVATKNIEVAFLNHCRAAHCDENDFKYYYRVVGQRGNHGRQFNASKMVVEKLFSPETGACMPACEVC